MADDGVCEMKRLYVREEFRGRGVGKFLTERLLDDARKIGYQTMRLDTLRRMDAARSIYQKLGFTVSSAYYDNPMDGVVYMELQL